MPRKATPKPEPQKKKPASPVRRRSPVANPCSRAVSTSLAAISHDIRAPLNAIIGMAGLLAETTLTPDQKQYVQVCRSAGESLLALVNDLLDLSRIEAGRLVLAEVEFNTASVAEDACEVLAFTAQQKGIELACRIDSTVPPVAVGDPARLRQILINLVGNAVKYTDHGSVTVDVRPAPSGPKTPARTVTVSFAVTDTGIGIPHGKQAEVFNRFVQAEAATAGRGGVGLGLAIARELAMLMKGDITLGSTPGNGSTFTLTVPLPLPAHEPVTPPTPTLAGMRVLVVEPAAAHRGIVTASLTQAGADVTAAACCEDAVAALEQARSTQTRFDAIMLDCQTPGIEGAAIAALLHAGLTPEGRIVMMSGIHPQGTCTERCKLFGPVTVLTKPVRRSRLHDALCGIPAEVNGLRILLVDDSHDTEPLMRKYLDGCTLDTAANGAEAVGKVKATRFDAVLMDVEMPVMDGHAAARAIRVWERTSASAHTPIIALTAHACPEEIGKCIKAGCDAHLAKPVRKHELLHVLALHARAAVQGGAGTEPQPATAVPLPATAPRPVPQPSSPPAVPPAAPRYIASLDPDIQDLVPAFLEHRRDDLAALQRARDANDFATIARRGHIMKGSGSAYGFPELSALGAALEKAGIAQSAQEAATHIAALNLFLSRTEAS